MQIFNSQENLLRIKARGDQRDSTEVRALALYAVNLVRFLALHKIQESTAGDNPEPTVKEKILSTSRCGTKLLPQKN